MLWILLTIKNNFKELVIKSENY